MFNLWNYLALQLRSPRHRFISGVTVIDTDREHCLVDFLWTEYCCGAHLGVSVLRSAQLHICHNLIRTHSVTDCSSPLSHLQSILVDGNSARSLSNLGDDRGHSCLGLLDQKSRGVVQPKSALRYDPPTLLLSALYYLCHEKVDSVSCGSDNLCLPTEFSGVGDQPGRTVFKIWSNHQGEVGVKDSRARL